MSLHITPDGPYLRFNYGYQIICKATVLAYIHDMPINFFIQHFCNVFNSRHHVSVYACHPGVSVHHGFVRLPLSCARETDVMHVPRGRLVEQRQADHRELQLR